jgi:hypothetical protein
MKLTLRMSGERQREKRRISERKRDEPLGILEEGLAEGSAAMGLGMGLGDAFEEVHLLYCSNNLLASGTSKWIYPCHCLNQE